MVCLAGTIICLVLPKDLVKVTTTGTMTTEVNYASLGIEIPEDELEQLEEMQDWMSEDGKVQVETVRHGVVTTDMPSSEVTVTLRSVVGVLLVLILVYIFKYGAVLQQESDETL